jgi:hypothetical protein
MNPPQPNDDDAKLRKALREWQVDAGLPPRFQEAVWRRIAASETRTSGTWQNLLDAIRSMFARPAVAAVWVAVFMVAGISVGWMQARERVARIDVSLSTRYVQSVDPYQRPR